MARMLQQAVSIIEISKSFIITALDYELHKERAFSALIPAIFITASIGSIK